MHEQEQARLAAEAPAQPKRKKRRLKWQIYDWDWVSFENWVYKHWHDKKCGFCSSKMLVLNGKCMVSMFLSSFKKPCHAQIDFINIFVWKITLAITATMFVKSHMKSILYRANRKYWLFLLTKHKKQNTHWDHHRDGLKTWIFRTMEIPKCVKSDTLKNVQG